LGAALFHRLAGVDSLGSIYASVADCIRAAVDGDLDGIAIDHPDDLSKLTLALRGWLGGLLATRARDNEDLSDMDRVGGFDTVRFGDVLPGDAIQAADP